MENHGKWRTPWTVWKGKNIGHWKRNSPGWWAPSPKRYMYSYLRTSDIPTAKTWGQPKRSSADEQIKKVWWYARWNTIEPVREWNHAIFSNMDGPRAYHTKGRTSNRESQIPYDVTYMWNLKKFIQMDLSMKQKENHGRRDQTCGCQGVEEVGEGRSGSLGWADANFYMQDGWMSKS